MIRRLVMLLALAAPFLPGPAAAAPPSSLPGAGAALAVAAHEIGQSYVYLRVYEDSLTARLEITASDLERALGFGWDPEAGVSEAQVMERLDSIRGYMESHFSIGSVAGPYEPIFREASLLEVPFGTFVQLSYFLAETAGIPDEIEVEFSPLFEIDRTHRNFLLIEHNWKTATFNNESGISLVFTPGSTRQSLDLTSSSLWRGFKGLIWLGVLHIWIGIDHILFLVALILPSVLVRQDGRWRPVQGFREGFFNIVTVITFFTLAHSVTLALAGLGVVRLPSALVESVIAASIAVAAAANLRPRLRIREWTLAFVFGLFHGFGFASVMGDVGVGTDRLALSVFGFNVGVELGQLAIILVVFPALFLLRDRRIYLPAMKLGSAALIAISLIWFGERAFGWDIYVTQIARDVLSLLPGIG
ncbi:MAG TPA: HupE/UreJ family protein [Longimicrobiales bacterium]|nr:HupE/UreJ family protein [Longimicrobiales bacterium]